MALEISIHEAQASILRDLLFLPSAGFAELQKTAGLSSDHFNFHLARLVELELVERNQHGKYRLTAPGKEYANRMDTDERKIERQGKIAALVVPRRQRADGTVEYMVQKRLKQPFYGFYGFMTGKIRWGEAIAEGAARELMEETGLKAKLTFKGTYHKRDYTPEGKLLEDKHFYIMLADDPSGDFMATFEGGENAWFTRKKILALEKAFSRMDIPLNAVTQEGIVFAEESFTYGPDEY